MTNLRQNLLYVFITFGLFFLCIKTFAGNLNTNPKGVFLPSINFTKADAIPANKVKVQMINHSINTTASLGNINVTGHQSSANISQDEVCKSNLAVAIKIAAENGISRLEYYCSPFDDQYDVELESFGFRELSQ